MKVALFSILLIATTSYAETFKCPHASWEEGKSAYIVLDGNNVTLINWGGETRGPRTVSVLRERNKIIVDLRETESDKIFLSHKKGNEFKFDYADIRDDRTDSCIKL